MLHTRRTFSFEHPPEEAEFALFGIPWDASETGTSVKHGPLFIREALKNIPGYDPQTKTNPFERKWTDLGDIEPVVNNWKLTKQAITETINELLTTNPNIIPITMGGDHLITLGILEVLKQHKKFTVVHFDAHADLSTDWMGEPYAHITWASHILKDLKLVQFGVRSMTQEEAVLIEQQKIPQNNLEAITGPIYVTVDLDVLDPGFAPDVGTPEPNGMDPKTFFSLLDSLFAKHPLVGLDIVECAATRINTPTAVIAAQVIKKAAVYSKV
ncbi:MAG: arginase family protein [Nanoarchaeota archaeon]|nr:arginase family protein [Nanoarchaeota archaeon]